MKLTNKLISTIAAAAILSTVSVNAQDIVEPTGLDQIIEIIQVDSGIQKGLNRAKLLLT